MHANYFLIFQKGMPGQLAELSLDEMALYIRNHLYNFLIDDNVGACFIERLANDPNGLKHPICRKYLLYFLDKCIQMRPLRPALLDAMARLTGDERCKAKLKVINALNTDEETLNMILGLNLSSHIDDVREFLNTLILSRRSHVAAAQYALYVDKSAGSLPGPWLKDFKCPGSLRAEWDINLFAHYAGICAWDQAMEMWPGLDVSLMREVALNHAGDMFAALGETEKALEWYGKSVAMDPLQTPLYLRMRELESPFKPDHSLVDTKKVAILLYSWNKAEVLANTLDSLSRSEVGPADIHVLLNGCSDNSRELVDLARAKFPHNTFIVHELHVNIGAPAARNWLMNLPEVLKTDYIAFLDDDVEVQRDWLAHFLTVAEADPQVAVVGCKIVNPGEARRIQYLFRYVAIADHGLLKVSLDTPNTVYDTGTYTFVRETRSVMGCQHLLRTSAQAAAKHGFDIRFSPSQVDDIEHDLALCLAGYKVMYCGTVTCTHLQQSGRKLFQEFDPSRTGNTMGNDLKLYFKYFNDLPRLKALDNLSIDLGVPLPEF
ncbi:MAG: glycosyltransferase family A protein [Pseudomonadota bacterium]